MVQFDRERNPKLKVVRGHFESESRSMKRKNADAGRRKGKFGKVTLSGKYRSDGKLKDIYDDYSDEDMGNGDRLHLRKERSTKYNTYHGKKGDYEDRGISADVSLAKLTSKKAERFEKSADRLGLKGKITDRVVPVVVRGHFESESRSMKRKNADSGRSKGKFGKVTLSGKYRSDGKLKDIYDDYSDEDKGNGDRLHLRKEQSTKYNTYHGKKGDYEDRGISADVSLAKLTSKQAERFEKSADRLGLKGKIMDRVVPVDRRAVGSDDESKKQIEKKDEAGQIAEQKRERFQTRILDKTGKKIRVNRKALTDVAAESNLPLKKKKRVIKLDPHDISNKRLDDSVFTKENVEEKKPEMSKNAQFRAIQPTPAILSFVEDNLLGRRRLIELQNAGYNVKLSAPLDNVPFSTSTERERIEENVFRSKLEFFAAAKISSSFPAPMIPEIAFAGRSNVGKSSLLNALTRQWGVVRTSDKPGLTQTINFFRLASKLCLVDLPGYGFAYAKEEVKDAWEELVKEYVSTRVGLQQVCVLVDTKWGMKPRDHELIDLMERSKTPYQIVLTKTDLVIPIDVARRAMQIQEDFKSNKSIVNPVMMMSSKSGAGIRSFRTVLAKLARFVKP